MKYYLISILFQRDEGDLWVYNCAMQLDCLPTLAYLKEFAIGVAFSNFIGITGISELSKVDYEIFMINES